MKKKRILSLMAAAAMASSLMCSAVAPAYAVNLENTAVAGTKKAVEREPSTDILYGEISREIGYFSSSDKTSFAEILNGMITLYNENGAFEPEYSRIKFYCEKKTDMFPHLRTFIIMNQANMNLKLITMVKL